MYGQHIGKWPRKGFRGKGGRGCWTKAACAVHISIWQEHMRPVCIWDSDTLTNGSLGRPKPKPASKLKPKQTEFVIARLPACVCMGMGIVWVYMHCMCVCVSGESRKRAVVTRKPQQLKKQPIQVESVGLPSCDCGLLLLLLPWLLLLLPSSEQQESASK